MLIFLLSFLAALITYYFFARRPAPTFGAARSVDVAPGTRRGWLTIRGPVELIITAFAFMIVLNLIAYIILDQLYSPAVGLFTFADFVRSEFAAQIAYGVASGFVVGRIIALSSFAEATDDEKRRNLIERRRRFYASGLVALVVVSLLTASGNSIGDLLGRVTVFKTPFAELQVATAPVGGGEMEQATVVADRRASRDNVLQGLQFLALFDQIVETDRLYGASSDMPGDAAVPADAVPPPDFPERYQELVAPMMRCLMVVYLIDRDRTFVAEQLGPLVRELRAVAHRPVRGNVRPVDLSGVTRDLLDRLRTMSARRAGEAPLPVSADRALNLETECTPARFDELRRLIFAPAEGGAAPGGDRISAMVAGLPRDRRPYLSLFLAYALMASGNDMSAAIEIDRWRREHAAPASRDNPMALWYRFRLNRELILLLAGMAGAEVPDASLLLADLNGETLAIIEHLAGRADWDEVYASDTACRDTPLRRSKDDDLALYLRRHHIYHSNLFAYYAARTFAESDRHLRDALVAAERVYDYSLRCSTLLDLDFKNIENIENLETASSVFAAFAREFEGARYLKSEIPAMLAKASAGYGRCLRALEKANVARLDAVTDPELAIGARIDSLQPLVLERCRRGAEELTRLARKVE